MMLEKSSQTDVQVVGCNRQFELDLWTKSSTANVRNSGIYERKDTLPTEDLD